MSLFTVGRGGVAHCAAILMALQATACYNPEAGLPVPKDPGTVVATVRDAEGSPVSGVTIHVHNIPNSVGSTYSVGQSTDRNGVTKIEAIPAGPRVVEVTLPAGFTAVSPAARQDVVVVKDQVVAVAFVLRR